MDVMLNGEARNIPDGVTVAQLLQQLNIQPERVAVEVNLTVLKRAQLPEVSLRPGDQVEIVQLIGGGSLDIQQTEDSQQRTASKKKTHQRGTQQLFLSSVLCLLSAAPQRADI